VIRMWWVFEQNNSGGHFIIDDKVSYRVVIEADTANQADNIADKILDNVGSCRCCGPRWGSASEWACHASKEEALASLRPVDPYYQEPGDNGIWAYVYGKEKVETFSFDGVLKDV